MLDPKSITLVFDAQIHQRNDVFENICWKVENSYNFLVKATKTSQKHFPLTEKFHRFR